MVRLRQFDRDKDVLVAARERMAHIYDVFDTVVVSVSGGKDSLAALHLALESTDGPVHAVFRDLEFLPPSLLDVIREVQAHPRVQLRWLVLASHGSVNILGTKRDFTHWDPARRDTWHRQPPEGSVQVLDRVLDPGQRDAFIADAYPGRVALVTGVRAAESLLRYRASVNKLNEPYINASPAGAKVAVCKPLYDWHENDVFKYLHEQGARWASAYDARAWAGVGELRTGSAIAVEELRKVRVLRESEPDLYAALLDVIPEIAVADRYYDDYDRHSEEERMVTLADVEEWVREAYTDPASLTAALDKVDFARRLAVQNPDGFPPWWVYREIKRDGHGKGMLPIPTTHPRHPSRQASRG